VKSGRLSVLVYHGNKERKITKREMAQYDVIITTYGIILSEVKRTILSFFSGTSRTQDWQTFVVKIRTLLKLET
jgi:hypothetical protein